MISRRSSVMLGAIGVALAFGRFNEGEIKLCALDLLAGLFLGLSGFFKKESTDEQA